MKKVIIIYLILLSLDCNIIVFRDFEANEEFLPMSYCEQKVIIELIRGDLRQDNRDTIYDDYLTARCLEETFKKEEHDPFKVPNKLKYFQWGI